MSGFEIRASLRRCNWELTKRRRAVSCCETLWTYTLLWANCLECSWSASALTEPHIIYCHQDESKYFSVVDIKSLELAVLYYFFTSLELYNLYFLTSFTILPITRVFQIVLWQDLFISRILVYFILLNFPPVDCLNAESTHQKNDKSQPTEYFGATSRVQISWRWHCLGDH